MAKKLLILLLIFAASCSYNSRRPAPPSPWASETANYRQNASVFHSQQADESSPRQNATSSHVPQTDTPANTNRLWASVDDQAGEPENMQTAAKTPIYQPGGAQAQAGPIGITAAPEESDENQSNLALLSPQPENTSDEPADVAVLSPQQPEIIDEPEPTTTATTVYHYYPNEEIYVHPASSSYMVCRNGSWITLRSWPTYMSMPSLYVSLRCALSPWRRHHVYRSRYPHGYCHRSYSSRRISTPTRVYPTYPRHRHEESRHTRTQPAVNVQTPVSTPTTTSPRRLRPADTTTTTSSRYRSTSTRHAPRTQPAVNVQTPTTTAGSTRTHRSHSPRADVTPSPNHTPAPRILPTPVPHHRMHSRSGPDNNKREKERK